MLLLKVTHGGPIPPGRYKYYQAETKTPIGPHGTFRQLLAEIKIHRKSNNIPIGTDFDHEIQDWLCRHMESPEEYCVDASTLQAPPVKPARTSPTGFDGREHWRRLHMYALTENPTPQNREFWLADFAKSVPCGDCRRTWRALTASFPLSRQASPADFFKWTVDRHNDVNEKIGHPVLTLEQATEIWSR